MNRKQEKNICDIYLKLNDASPMYQQLLEPLRAIWKCKRYVYRIYQALKHLWKV